MLASRLLPLALACALTACGSTAVPAEQEPKPPTYEQVKEGFCQSLDFAQFEEYLGAKLPTGGLQDPGAGKTPTFICGSSYFGREENGEFLAGATVRVAITAFPSREDAERAHRVMAAPSAAVDRLTATDLSVDQLSWEFADAGYTVHMQHGNLHLTVGVGSLSAAKPSVDERLAAVLERFVRDVLTHIRQAQGKSGTD